MKEKKECNFEDAKQGAVISTTSGKQRIIIRIDTDILNWFCGWVHKAGGGNYQTPTNYALWEYILQKDGTLERTLRKEIHEEVQTLIKRLMVQ